MSSNRITNGHIVDSPSLTTENIIADYKKNLKEMFPSMKEKNFDQTFDNLKFNIVDAPIPSIWQEYIDQCHEKMFLAIPDPRLKGSVISAWTWAIDPDVFMWKVIFIISTFGAGSVKRLFDFYSSIAPSLGEKPLKKKAENAFKEKLRRALETLAACFVLEKRVLDRKELGHGRFTVVIYSAPEHLRLPGVLEREIAYYTKGGGRSTGKKNEPDEEKTPMDGARKHKNYHYAQKFVIAEDSIKKKSKTHKFFKCENGCDVGIKEYPTFAIKTDFSYKIKKYKIFCKDCDNFLVQIDHKEYLDLIFKKNFDIDPAILREPIKKIKKKKINPKKKRPRNRRT